MTIRICDIETEGSDPTIHRVVEIASVDLEDSGQLLAPRTTLVNPGPDRQMPPDAQGIHHISSDMLKAEPPLAAAVRNVLTPFPFPLTLTAFAAHNAAFEIGFLKQFTGETPWLCTMKIAMRLWPDCPNFKNWTLFYFLKLQIPDKMKGGIPHRALPDAVVTACLLKNALTLASIEDMLQWSQEPPLMPRCPIGWDGVPGPIPWPQVKMKCLTWIMGKPDIGDDLKWNAQREIDRRAAPLDALADPSLLELDQSLAAETKLAEQWPADTAGDSPADIRAAYMMLARHSIAESKSLDDLESWYRGERQSRELNGVIDGTEEYQEITRLCRAQKALWG